MKVAALMYHDIVEPGRSDASGFGGAAAAHYKLEYANFEQHLEAMGTSGLRFGSITEPSTDALSHVLTFDDGGCSAVRIAEALTHHGMTGHFFITTSRIGQLGFVTEADLRHLRALGHRVGSHSHTHPADMSRLRPDALEAEWQQSVSRLQQVLGESISVASVPGGFYTQDVAHSAARSGIRYLFTSEPTTQVQQIAGVTVIGRYALLRNTPSLTAIALLRGDANARERQWLSWNLKKPLKRWARPVYSHVRQQWLGASH